VAKILFFVPKSLKSLAKRLYWGISFLKFYR
jgi:hypothetical protein